MPGFELMSGVGEDDAAAAERIIDARLAELGARYPRLIALLGGTHIRLAPGALLEDSWHGQSDPGRITLPVELKQDRSPASPGGRRVEFEPSLLGVLDHEIGHEIEAGFAKAAGLDIGELFARQDRAAIETGLSPYAAQDEHEWFAESLAAWLHPERPAVHFDLDPDLAQAFQRILTTRGAHDASWWTYQASSPTPSWEEAIAAGAFKGSKSEWESLSPGMRREILRTWKRKADSAGLITVDDGEITPHVEKHEADYTNTGDVEHCRLCEFWRPPDACALVIGTISPVGWCKFFQWPDGRADTAGEAGDDPAQPLVRGAGMLLIHHGDGGDRVLFVLNRERGTWEFPGGAIEGDETAEEAAKRETLEEVGEIPYGSVSLMLRDRMTGVDYSTFMAQATGTPEPTLSDEHTAWKWAAPGEPPEPLHPGVRLALARLGMNELDLARAIASGEYSSPQQFENIWLYALRITGTGISYRPELSEFVWRDPKLYLNADFLARCNGLAVIWQHPPGESLTQDEYENRVLGAIMLPYVAGDEVWGIAKIYDQDAALMMLNQQLSTSPAVVFRDPGANKIRKLTGGKHLLIEAEPSLLDHLAICGLGVWDKGGSPTGVAVGEAEMADGHIEVPDRADAIAELNRAIAWMDLTRVTSAL